MSISITKTEQQFNNAGTGGEFFAAPDAVHADLIAREPFAEVERLSRAIVSVSDALKQMEDGKRREAYAAQLHEVLTDPTAPDAIRIAEAIEMNIADEKLEASQERWAAYEESYSDQLFRAFKPREDLRDDWDLFCYDRRRDCCRRLLGRGGSCRGSGSSREK